MFAAYDQGADDAYATRLDVRCMRADMARLDDGLAPLVGRSSRGGRDAMSERDREKEAQQMTVDPARQIEMARQLARDVKELSDHFPAEWDGGEAGYLAAGMCGLADDILAAAEDRA